jgi:predicted HicB family RNase H-like nuclease
MTKNLTVRLDDELAADTEAPARAEGASLNETVKKALAEAIAAGLIPSSRSAFAA